MKKNLQPGDIIKVKNTANKLTYNVEIDRVTKTQAIAKDGMKFKIELGGTVAYCIPKNDSIMCAVIQPEDLGAVKLPRRVVATLHLPAGMTGETLVNVKNTFKGTGTLQDAIIRKSRTRFETITKEVVKTKKVRSTSTKPSGEPKGKGLIEQIIALHVVGKTNKEI